VAKSKCRDEFKKWEIPGTVHHCHCCQKKLNPKTMVWLELNCTNNLWSDPDVSRLPESKSQGCFEFGATCAKNTLQNQRKQ